MACGNYSHRPLAILLIDINLAIAPDRATDTRTGDISICGNISHYITTGDVFIRSNTAANITALDISVRCYASANRLAVDIAVALYTAADVAAPDISICRKTAADGTGNLRIAVDDNLMDLGLMGIRHYKANRLTAADLICLNHFISIKLHDPKNLVIRQIRTHLSRIVAMSFL